MNGRHEGHGEGRATGRTLVDPRTITRPDPALNTYYLISSFAALIFFPIFYVPLLLKYRTLRYRFDEDGVAMSWGQFNQRETYLNYRRIQDIQVSRGLVQRWLGLADLQLQTASGGAGAEMTIEGIRNPERLRDFLYERMRGAGDEHGEEEPAGEDAAGAGDEALALLREIRDELRLLREGR
jgi:uncharacterized protein